MADLDKRQIEVLEAKVAVLRRIVEAAETYRNTEKRSSGLSVFLCRRALDKQLENYHKLYPKHTI